jgi:tRNA G37 N-methylase Trm5
LIHGKAKHVTACEWNVHAICALRYNLLANRIGEDRVTILEGDCRANLERLLWEKEVNANDDGFGYDRISLTS